MKRRKSRNYFLPIILITLLITIGYSAIQTQLSIKGNISASSTIYNINWNNIQTTEGSITPTTSPTISNNKTELNYSLNFTNSGDYYEFSFDSINNGSNDAMIKSITSKINDQDISNVPSILEYTVSYSDGTEIGLKDYLKKGNDSKETITIKVKVKDSATNTEITNLNQPLNFKFIIDYVKADSTAKKVVHGVHCTYEGEMTQGAEYVNGDYRYRYKQEVGENGWTNITDDGWGVRVADTETDSVLTSPLCSSINGKPIVSMSRMFNSTSHTEVDLSTFNTSQVKNMDSMFKSTSFEELDLSSFDTSNVTNMSNMFDYSFVYELDLSTFDTSKVIDMAYMFNGSSAETINVSSFDTSNVTNMSHMFSFSDVLSLDLRNFDTSKVTNMEGMFEQPSQLNELDVSSFNTSNVENMSSMFMTVQAPQIDTSKFNTSKVKDMSSMFSGIEATSLNLLSFNTSNVTNMVSMFYGFKGSTLDLSSFNTSKVTNMTTMFYSCTNLSTIYVGSGWSVDNVTSNNSNNMFYNDTKLPHFSRYYVNKTRANTSNNGYLTLKT